MSVVLVLYHIKQCRVTVRMLACSVHVYMCVRDCVYRVVVGKSSNVGMYWYLINLGEVNKAIKSCETVNNRNIHNMFSVPSLQCVCVCVCVCIRVFHLSPQGKTK